jgi:hypothetical protein
VLEKVKDQIYQEEAQIQEIKDVLIQGNDQDIQKSMNRMADVLL